MQASSSLINFLKKEEGFSSCPYEDGGYYSVGYGHQTTDISSCISQQQAETILIQDISKYEQAVNDSLTVKVTQSQFDALVSFCYNVGIYGFKGSTLLNSVNNKADSTTIKNSFLAWVTTRGQYSSALENRRNKEISLYFWDTRKNIIILSVVVLALIALVFYLLI